MRKSAVAAVVLGGVALLVTAGCHSIPAEELKKSIEIVDLETKWVSKYYQPWPPRLIVVPQVTFKMKNVGARELSYLNFNAIFNFKGDPENFGDAFLAAIRSKGVPPGGTSQAIVLKSNFGVEGKTLKGIEDNPAWKPAELRLYVIAGGSQPVLLGVYDVSRFIDFKEPEAAAPKKEEEKK